MNFTDDSRLIVSGFAFLEFAPLECFSQKCIEDLEIGTILIRILFLQPSVIFFIKIPCHHEQNVFFASKNMIKGTP